MGIDVTIALAVHKSEEYISACIKALLAQTIKDIEILIVEDPLLTELSKWLILSKMTE